MIEYRSASRCAHTCLVRLESGQLCLDGDGCTHFVGPLATYRAVRRTVIHLFPW